MLHILLVVLGALCVFFALFGSLYITGFAILGINEPLQMGPVSAQTRFLVFVPAHNEGAGIQDTLRSIQRGNYPPEQIRIIVIADNCTDDTAERARACGVEAWIRDDPHHRGKGQALNWAFARPTDPFDLAAIIDADTEIDPAFFAAMDSTYTAFAHRGCSDVVLQGRYLFARSSDVSSWFEQYTIATKAAENSFSYRPRTILGLANLIQGNGFCISRSALSKVPFGAMSIVEDAEYAVTLAVNGVQVAHVDEARVVSRMTRRLRDAASQRLRWASGTFALLVHAVPQLLKGAIQQRVWQLAEMALMLLLTSRLVLVYATTISVVLLISLRSSPIFNVLAPALAASLCLQSIYLYLVLRKADSVPVPFQMIAFMPLYFGFLGAMQLGAVLGLRKRQWSRTTR